MRTGIDFFKIIVSVDILTSFHESQIFSIASRITHPLQVFTVLYLDTSEESLCQLWPKESIYLIKRPESQNDSLI